LEITMSEIELGQPHPADKPFVSQPLTPAAPIVEPVKPAINPATPDAGHDTAAKRLRAFEDKHFGKRAVRLNGRIERGYGSPFKEMTPERQAEYASIESLVEAEQNLDAANAVLSKAKSDYDIAETNVKAATKVSEARAAEAKKVESEDAAAEKPVQQKDVAPAPAWAPAPEPRLDAFGKPTDPAHTGV
jgi:hypothetical protein